jgi:ketosteroid isomerase-like protein
MASTESSKNDATSVMQVLADYYRTFSTLDLEKTSAFFHEPALLVGQRGVLAVPAHAELAVAVASTFEDLRSRGYGRSELSQPKLTMLSGTAALVIDVAERYKTDGQPLDRAGVTYVLQKTDPGWQIAVLVLHDPGGAVPASSQTPSSRFILARHFFPPAVLNDFC